MLIKLEHSVRASGDKILQVCGTSLELEVI